MYSLHVLTCLITFLLLFISFEKKSQLSAFILEIRSIDHQASVLKSPSNAVFSSRRKSASSAGCRDPRSLIQPGLLIISVTDVTLQASVTSAFRRSTKNAHRRIKMQDKSSIEVKSISVFPLRLLDFRIILKQISCVRIIIKLKAFQTEGRSMRWSSASQVV